MESYPNTKEELKQENQENNKKLLENGQHNAFLYIPAYVADNPNIDDAALILFGRLNALSNRKGYCFASNEYLAQLTKVTVGEVKKRLKTLDDQGVIKRFTKRDGMGWDRKIYTCNNYSQIISTKDSHGSFEGPIQIFAKDSYGSNNNISNNNISIKKEVASEDAPFLSKYLFSKLREKNSKYKEPNLKQWAKEIDLMIKIDQRTKDEILSILDWAFKQTDDFWPTAIQSPKTLRKLFDSAWLKKNHHLQKEGLKEELRGRNLTWVKNKIEDLARIGARGNLRYDETEVFDDVLGVRTSLTAAKMVDIVKGWDKMRFKR